MSETYETYIGPVHPGRFKSPSPQLQQSERMLAKQICREDCWITFSVTHESLDPERVTAMLDLKPDDVLHKNEIIAETNSCVVRSPWTRWSYTVGAAIADHDAAELLDLLLEDLSGKTPSIRQLQSEGAKLQIFIHFDQYSCVSHIQITAETFAKLAQLRLNLQIIVNHHSLEEEREKEEDDDGC